MAQKPFEEYEVGESYESYGRTITEADLVNFTCLAGLKSPLFIDVEYCARESRFGQRLIPGMLTASLAAGMLEDILGRYLIAGLGIERLSFTAPVFIGDTLRSTIAIASMRLTSDGKRGVLGVRIDTRNQRGVGVMEFSTSFMMKRGHE